LVQGPRVKSPLRWGWLGRPLNANGGLATEAARLVRSQPSMPEVYGAAARKSEARQRSSVCRREARIRNERASKELSATAQPSLMSQSGWDLRESQQPARQQQQHQRSQQRGRGDFGAQFLKQ
jgi:hypothetical protein